MKVAEVAKRWGISTRSIYRMIDMGLIPTYQALTERPIFCTHVDEQFVEEVQQLLVGKEVNPNVIRTIAWELSKKEE